jgi:hypothetical protein
MVKLRIRFGSTKLLFQSWRSHWAMLGYVQPPSKAREVAQEECFEFHALRFDLVV